jgi:phosphoenolpyruvate carboxykinase (GTP)
MASETTAAMSGQVGVTRRDPMAMLPFCGYNMGDYFGHWLEMGRRVARPPKIFHVNWFRRGDDGKFLWPGYGENVRVLKWILDRAEGRAEAVETAIGLVPSPESLPLQGLPLSARNVEELLRVDAADWIPEHAAIGEFFEKFGRRLPDALREEHERFGQRLHQSVPVSVK